MNKRLSNRSKKKLQSHPREIVEVRCEEEILRTLDKNGCLEGLPFMTEMKKYCGRRFKVMKRVDSMLIEGLGPRRMSNTVILAGAACDGSAHDGCQRTCPVLWKEAWLKRADYKTCGEPISDLDTYSETSRPQKQMVLCQLANLKRASHTPRSLEGLVQYLSSQGPGRLTRPLMRLLTISLWVRRLFSTRMDEANPDIKELHSPVRKTPLIRLNLKPGESVEVKSKEEIISTLDSKGRNRGLTFTAEMLKYCGKRYRVLKRVDKMINDIGRMRSIPNTVILENVVCDGSYHDNCPRNCYCLWREAWLKRVD